MQGRLCSRFALSFYMSLGLIVKVCFSLDFPRLKIKIDTIFHLCYDKKRLMVDTRGTLLLFIYLIPFFGRQTRRLPAPESSRQYGSVLVSHDLQGVCGE